MDIQPLFACAVGRDVHRMVIPVGVIVQVQDNELEVHRRQFGTCKRDLRAMADWIAAFSPDTVVMESTGIYWKSPYFYLERVGLRAVVVNAQHVKQVPGRKTDTAMPKGWPCWRGPGCCAAVLARRNSCAIGANSVVTTNVPPPCWRGRKTVWPR